MGKQTALKQSNNVERAGLYATKLLERTRSLEAKAKEPPVPLITKIKHFEDFFVRSPNEFQPKSFNRDKAFLELVRHVFVKYPVPRVLSHAFATTNPLHWDWYVHVVQGGSFAKLMKDHLTKREAHLFLSSRQQLGINETIVWSIATAAGAKDGTATRLARSTFGTVMERYKDRYNPILTAQWRDVVRFFATNEPESVQQINDLADYFRYAFATQPNFTVFGAGHTIKSLCKRMVDWHHETGRNKRIGGGFWNGHPFADWIIERQNNQTANGVLDQWSFRQILTGDALAEEGSRMRHCVASYKSFCVSGGASIWSARCNNERKLTIELRHFNGSYEIAQVRGLANRQPHGSELFIVQEWARQNNLRYRGW